MQNKTHMDISSSSSEDLSDKEAAIITNIDEFCTINELQPNNTNKNNVKKNNNIISKTQQRKINEPFKISTPIPNISNDNMNFYSLLLNGENNPKKAKKNSKKKLKYKKKSKKKEKNINNNIEGGKNINNNINNIIINNDNNNNKTNLNHFIRSTELRLPLNLIDLSYDNPKYK